MNQRTSKPILLAVLALLLIVRPCPGQGATATIGGRIFSGRQVDRMPDHTTAPPLNEARVMVQTQEEGAFVTYGTVAGNGWSAEVPAPGDYIAMFAAPGHDATSREFMVSAAGEAQQRDAYLPPLPLPLANLLVFTFYENEANGEWDEGTDPPLNGVTVQVRDEAGQLLATGVTGTQRAITTAEGRVLADANGLFYFTGLPAGRLRVSADPATAHLYDVSGPQPLAVSDPASRRPLEFDSSTEFYQLSSEEGGHAFEVVLHPGDPGTAAGTFMAWHGFTRKLGQIGSATNPLPFNPTLVGTISGRLLDADPGRVVAGEAEAGEALIPARHPGVSANTVVPAGLVILQAASETRMPQVLATTEADPQTGRFDFINVPPGRYRLLLTDLPLSYIPGQREVGVGAGERVLVSDGLATPEGTGVLLPRFFARLQGQVLADGVPLTESEVHLRLADGSIWQRTVTDRHGWYGFDTLPELETLAYVDVGLPAGYRGALTTDTFYPHAALRDPLCDPLVPGCVEPGEPYPVTHNAMARPLQWYTASYRADLLLTAIPAASGDVAGFVFYDRLEAGSWQGNGVYDRKADRTLPGVTVKLWDAAGTTLLATTESGAFDREATLAQGWREPATLPLDGWGGVFAGPLPGFYEFRDLAPGTYQVEVVPPAGLFPTPSDRQRLTVTVSGGARQDVDFGLTTLVPLAGEIEGGVFDDINLDPRPGSLLYLEKAGLAGRPAGGRLRSPGLFSRGRPHGEPDVP